MTTEAVIAGLVVANAIHQTLRATKPKSDRAQAALAVAKAANCLWYLAFVIVAATQFFRGEF